MVTKKKGGVTAVSEGGVHATLRRSQASGLAPDEEKVMRMRLGASPPRTAPLERCFDAGSDLEIEVRAAEIEAWMRRKAQLAEREERRALPSRLHQQSRVKDKIIRALRKKT